MEHPDEAPSEGLQPPPEESSASKRFKAGGESVHAHEACSAACVHYRVRNRDRVMNSFVLQEFGIPKPEEVWHHIRKRLPGQPESQVREYLISKSGH